MKPRTATRLVNLAIWSLFGLVAVVFASLIEALVDADFQGHQTAAAVAVALSWAFASAVGHAHASNKCDAEMHKISAQIDAERSRLATYRSKMEGEWKL
jgi:hypothetical protein